MLRFLYCDNDVGYRFTSETFTDTPPYAILSHTWGSDEIEFADILKSPGDCTRKTQAAFRKIDFCAAQARKDGLRHFWVDTCCVNKHDYVELQNAINSMFRWYRDAERCYVYLDDVSKSYPEGLSRNQNTEPWVIAFRNSRWFTRGWTLQELIAPNKVDFYSREWEWLGDKQSLEAIICEVTGIPASALRGTPLHKFSVSERESWMRNRHTKYDEDMAYSLLGIFNVYLPLIYGEGRENATRRLREEITKTKDLRVEDTLEVDHGMTQNGLGSWRVLNDAAPNKSGSPQLYKSASEERYLKTIHRSMTLNGAHRVVALHGLGGIGKTRLAMAYTTRYRNSYTNIFWFNMESHSSIRQSFTNMARQIIWRHPGAAYLGSLDLQHEHKDVVEAVKAWLSLPDNTDWLIVFDNYNNSHLNDAKGEMAITIRDFIPKVNRGSVIITTRGQRLSIAHPIQINRFSTCESLEILSAISGRGNLQDGK